MILPAASPTKPETKSVTLADGQTFTVSVVRPNFAQRFNDEGRELMAFGNHGRDAWLNYRLGRINDSIVDWNDVTNEAGQPVPFTTQRLMALMDAAPEVASQLVEIANEAFRPLAVTSLKSPGDSGEGNKSTSSTSSTSVATPNSDDSANLPEQSVSVSAS